jgi:uncharacterized protein (TIGR02646 family)
MHHLDRAGVPVPACLADPPEGWTYADLRGADKSEIRDALLAMQAQRCAYCERRTGDDGRVHGHIEHLWPRSKFPDRSLDWDNMFWSCMDERTCGKFKDNCKWSDGRLKFNPADIIDPAQDDPEEYLLFVSDGTVTPRPGLEPAKRRRAEETIRVFQLNESAYLAKSRHDAIQPYLSAVTMLAELNPAVLSAYVAREIAQVSPRPHSTAIRHFLSSVAP